MFLPSLLLSFAGLTAAGHPSAGRIEPSWIDLNGQARSLETFRGRIVVLNFWATWCAPCLEELPDLVRIQNRYGMYGVQVVGASADPTDAAASVARFARRHGINFPVLLGADTRQMQALGVGAVLPATVVIDHDGEIVERIPGTFELAKLEALLERMLRLSRSATDDDTGAELVATADAHDHGASEHEHEPHGGIEASLVPS